jgi:hypothetical protein
MDHRHFHLRLFITANKTVAGSGCRLCRDEVFVL